MAEIADVKIKFGADGVSKIITAVDGVSKKLDSVRAAAEKASSVWRNALGTAIGYVAGNLTTQLIPALKNAALSVDNLRLSLVQAVGTASNAPRIISSLTSAFIDLRARGIDVAADAFAYLAQRVGADVKQLAEAVERASTLTGVSQRDVAEAVVELGRVWQENTQQMVRDADVLTAALMSIGGSAPEFINALRQLAPTAYGAGLSLRELVAILLAFNDAGVGASQSAQMIRRVLLAMETGKLEELGIHGLAAERGLDGVADVLDEIRRKIDALPAGKLKEVFGDEAALAVKRVVEVDIRARLRSLEAETQRVPGAAAQTRSTFSVALTRFMASAGAMFQALGARWLPMFASALEATTVVLSRFQNTVAAVLVYFLGSRVAGLLSKKAAEYHNLFSTKKEEIRGAISKTFQERYIETVINLKALTGPEVDLHASPFLGRAVELLKNPAEMRKQIAEFEAAFSPNLTGTFRKKMSVVFGELGKFFREQAVAIPRMIRQALLVVNLFRDFKQLKQTLITKHTRPALELLKSGGGIVGADPRIRLRVTARSLGVLSRSLNFTKFTDELAASIRTMLFNGIMTGLTKLASIGLSFFNVFMISEIVVGFLKDILWEPIKRAQEKLVNEALSVDVSGALSAVDTFLSHLSSLPGIVGRYLDESQFIEAANQARRLNEQLRGAILEIDNQNRQIRVDMQAAQQTIEQQRRQIIAETTAAYNKVLGTANEISGNMGRFWSALAGWFFEGADAYIARNQEDLNKLHDKMQEILRERSSRLDELRKLEEEIKAKHEAWNAQLREQQNALIQQANERIAELQFELGDPTELDRRIREINKHYDELIEKNKDLAGVVQQLNAARTQEIALTQQLYAQQQAKQKAEEEARRQEEIAREAQQLVEETERIKAALQAARGLEGRAAEEAMRKAEQEYDLQRRIRELREKGVREALIAEYEDAVRRREDLLERIRRAVDTGKGVISTVGFFSPFKALGWGMSDHLKVIADQGKLTVRELRAIRKKIHVPRFR